MRSRAVWRPLACCFSTAFADAAWTASSSRRSRSCSLPAVVWMSIPESGAGTSVPAPGWVGCCVGCALTWCDLLTVACANLVVMTTTPPRTSLDLGRLQEAAGSRWTVELHDAVESSNAVAAAEPRRDHLVVVDHQTAGRGRLGRGWVVPAGAALTFSA